MSMRVTDLEKFALEQIWRPYQTKMGYDDRLTSLPVSLEKTAELLATDDTGWATVVLDRITRIGIRFPTYIQHPLVEVVRSAALSQSPSKPAGGSTDENH